ncbi:peptidylprolyl isomerase [Caenimonas aquaedulcis]|uniref:peptidylprolyl isomerase n=1 Tax=Caenimonas aquaedulcis TaxID=2793270 RepID=A0A931H505_9BURK|nr:peptidylprolyl isomerase [Caenimonas aquaedulcis]MBG9388597.1 peptidylprolyl isomerase [Caenimonas aquaedulcis]
MMSLFTSLRALLLVAALAAFGSAQANTMVRLHTILGPIDMSLLDSEAPRTVANFLAYVRAGDYTDDFIHRSAWLTSPATPFVIQGGGYLWTDKIYAIPSRGNLLNEFSPTRSNVRGTVAMAKGSTPDSATSQWFINMGNNAANLDNQNGGFTVFARVTAPSMAVADRIANLPRVNAGSPFTELPVYNLVNSTTVTRDNAVLITEVTEFPAVQTTSDRIFNYLEANFPQYAQPSKAFTGQAQGYDYRYYSGTNVYVGTKDGQVWYLLGAGDGVAHSLGTVADWLAVAQGAGY